MPKRLLILNPNSTFSITERLVRHAEVRAPAGVRVEGVTAGFGAPYIVDEVSCAVAGHAAVDAYKTHVAAHGAPEAVLLACFGDPGLFALEQLASGRVFGLAQASMATCAQAGRFAIVTGGAAWAPILSRLARTLGLDAALCGVQTIDKTGVELAADPQAAKARIAEACRAAAARWPDARVILLGGAGLAGLDAGLGATAGLPPVRDSVALGLDAAFGSLRAAGAGVGLA